MSEFMKQAIEKRLAELREKCAVKRLMVKEIDHYWGDGEYWDNRKRKARIGRPKDLAAADLELAEFIKEHRPIMGPDWIGNDHGRLCWDSYLGGQPINQHYCQLEEGHEGNHCNHLGAWPRKAED